MEVNYEEKLIPFHKPDNYSPPLKFKAISIKYKPRRGSFYIDLDYKITNNLTIKEEGLIDLGYGIRALSFRPYTVNIIRAFAKLLKVPLWR